VQADLHERAKMPDRKSNLTRKTIVVFGTVLTAFFIVVGFVASRVLERQIVDNAVRTLAVLTRSEAQGIEAHFRRLEVIGARSSETLSRWLSAPPRNPSSEAFGTRLKILNGALRTNLDRLTDTDGSGVFLSSRSELSDEVRSIIGATEGRFEDYARATTASVFNMYLITKHQFIRIYPKDWALEIEADHDFSNDIFYYSGDPQHDPSGKPVWTAPYYDSIWKRWMTSLVTPVVVDGEFIGIVGHDVILDDLYRTILDKKFLGSGYGFLFDAEGNIIVHPQHLGRLRESAEMGTTLATQDLGQPGLSAAVRRVLAQTRVPEEGAAQDFKTDAGQQHLLAYPLGVLDWHYGVVIPHDAMLELLPRFQSRFALGATAALALLFVATTAVLWRYILAPITDLKSSVVALSGGDLKRRAVVHSDDEIGQLGTAFNTMAERLGSTLESLHSDIAERQKIEEKLRRSEARYRRLIANIPVGLYTNTPGPQGHFVTANPAIADMFGYDSVQEFLKTPVATLYTNPEDRLRFSEQLAEEGAILAEELQLRRKDGSHMWGQVTARTVRNEAGEILYFDGMIQDVTERRVRQQEQQLLEEQLRQSQKMEAVGTLAGGIAHDFNNILAAIMGYTELVQENLPAGSDDNANLEIVLSAAGRAKELTKQILMFSRKADVVRQPLAISRIVGEASELLRKTIPSTVRLGFEIDTDTGTVKANATQLHQVVFNLCTNAYHALPDEEGEVRVVLKPVRIDRATAVSHANLAEGRYARLTVADTGDGMDPATLNRIFDPFFTTKDQGKGTGLGLAVVHGIVQEHGGAISVESTVGGGTAFHIFLPLMDSSPGLCCTERTRPNEGREHILFVDDEPMLAELGRKSLESLGYTVHATTSAEGAVERFRADPDAFDLVITDQTMPEMPGHSLATALMKIRPGVPVIICTGHSTVLDAEKARAIGVKAFMMKPITRNKLAATVRTVLDESREPVVRLQASV
jgi:PAS domain S-box-containing protein